MHEPAPCDECGEIFEAGDAVRIDGTVLIHDMDCEFPEIASVLADGEPPREHELKTWPPFFDAVVVGAKTFEVRREDRPFAVNDVLVLCEWNPKSKQYTGRTTRRRVTYIMRGGRFGLKHGYVVLGMVTGESEYFERGDRVDVDGQTGSVLGIEGDEALVWLDLHRDRHGASAPTEVALAECVRMPARRSNAVLLAYRARQQTRALAQLRAIASDESDPEAAAYARDTLARLATTSGPDEPGEVKS